MSAPRVSLARFEGPLDLLLSLVRKSELDITDIPIAEVTRQYLEYLHQAGEQKIELGSEFIYTAALLIHIKSRSLLPADPELARQSPDPRQELVQQLLDHERVRRGAEFLKQKLDVAEATCTRPALGEFETPEEAAFTDAPKGWSLAEVLRLARQALDSARTYELVSPPESVDVGQMTDWLEERLQTPCPNLEAGLLLAEQPDIPHRMALFLAILEMAKVARVRLDQQYPFGPIQLHRP